MKQRLERRFQMRSQNFSKDSKNQKPGMGRASSRFGVKEKPKSLKETIKRLVGSFKAEWPLMLLTIISVILSTTALLFVPYVFGKTIDAITVLDFDRVKQYALYLLAMYLCISFGNWFSQFTISKASQNILDTLRKSLFEKLEKLPLKYFDSHSHGDIISRFTNDLDAINNVISQSTITFLIGIYTVIGSSVMMLKLNVYLTLAVFISIPLLFLLSRTISKRTIHKFKGQQAAYGEINGIIEESIDGLSVLQNFNQEAHQFDKFKRANDNLYKYGKSAQIWSGLLMPLMNVINNLTFAIIGLIGGYMAIEGLVTVGIVASFIAYSRQFVRPLNELAFIYNSLMSAIAGAERVYNILDEIEEVRSQGLESKIEGKIEFKNVSFYYDEGVPVLRNLNFTIQPGEKVAIVGPTGAGKTTIVNLVSGFYKKQEGQILIDGHEISNIDFTHLMKQFGIVLQDSYLFSGTVFDNIKYGDLSVENDQIEAVAKETMVHHMIMKLPARYETQLSFGGLNISQGERQLLTISRAILSKPKMLILDEATSSVDLRTEKEITCAMQTLMAGRTSIVIAHRLSTIRDADHILVLNDGEIIEQGNHQSLMEKAGYYKKMIESQYAKEVV